MFEKHTPNITHLLPQACDKQGRHSPLAVHEPCTALHPFDPHVAVGVPLEQVSQAALQVLPYGDV